MRQPTILLDHPSRISRNTLNRDVIGRALWRRCLNLETGVVLMVLIFLLAFLLTGENVNAKPTQTAGHGEQQQTASQSPTLLPHNPHTEIDNPANAASSGESKERDAKDEAFKAEQFRQNRIIARATVFIAIFGGLSFGAALVYALVSVKQWKAINKQATHAGEQVGKMQGQLDAMKDQERAMRDALTENRKIFYLGQRAYLAITGFQFGRLDVDEEPVIQFGITNAGRTPAWAVRIRLILSIEPTDRDCVVNLFHAVTGKEVTKEVAAVIISGHPAVDQVEAGFIFDGMMRAETEEEFTRFYIRGEIYFTDISGEEQSLQFCRVSEGRRGDFQQCKPSEKQPYSDKPN